MEKMMSKMLNVSLLILVLVSMFMSGCDLLTEKPEKVLDDSIGDDMIINEIFALPPDRYYAYSWIELYNPTDRRIRWFDQSFPATAYTVGSNGTVLRTEDDGATWTPLTTGASETVRGVKFALPDTGYIVGDNGYLKRILRIGGVYNIVNPATPPPVVTNWNAISVVENTQSALVAGDGGRITRTSNYGRTWVTVTSPTTQNLHSIYIFGLNGQIYACGDSGVVMRGGVSTWTRMTLDPVYNPIAFRAIAFQADTGWVAGDNGTVLVSRNRGVNWAPESTAVSVTLRGIYFNRNFSKGWVVGDNGTILKKENFAQSNKGYTRQNSGTTTRLNSVYFTDSLNGWVFGDGGLILRTRNSGRTWITQTSGSSETLLGNGFLPLSVRIRSRLVIEMRALRKEFFIDVTQPFQEGVNPNFDYIVRRDTGSVFYDPGLLVDVGVLSPSDLPNPDPGGFVILKSDSLKFKDHTNIGPGKTAQVNFSIAFTDTNLFRARAVLWDLLSASEVRLLRIFRKQRVSTGEDIAPQSAEVVDLVRYGAYRPPPDQYPGQPELLFENNHPAGDIPEWWSLSRYVNDLGGPVQDANTAASFYMSSTPIPGWYSQRSKP